MAKLILVSNGTLQEIPMGQEITIGRAYSNLLRLEGDEISRVHAIIYKRGNDYVLRDLDSKNGVHLNEQKVATAVIAESDEIRIGTYVILFDPRPDFDMTGFLRKHNVNPDAQIQKDGPKEEDTDSAANHQPTFVSESSERIFFSLGDIDGWSDSQDVSQSAQFLSELLRLNRQLSVMPALEDTEDDSVLYQHFLNAAVCAIGAERGVIVLKDDARDALRLGAIISREKDVAVNRVVLRAVLRENFAVLCNDVQHDKSFQKTDTVQREQIGSLIAHPIMRGESVSGLIYGDVRERMNAFRREHVLILHFTARLLQLCMQQRAAVKH
jgi:pSer/pThr/pTyr-binding forkhead associated (FHA) protein